MHRGRAFIDDVLFVFSYLLHILAATNYLSCWEYKTGHRRSRFLHAI